jgi:hypothetical protein
MANPVIIREWFAVIDLSISRSFKDLLEVAVYVVMLTDC